MATLLLSAAGAALGSASGISAFGLSGMVLGRAVGATLGRVIDQRILGAAAGSGSEPVEYGRLERFRFTGAGDGAPVAELYGRMRLGGQVIWSTNFVENVSVSGGESGGGKGAPPRPASPEVREYSYTVSLAVALCEGEISRVGRIWADGTEIDRQTVNMRLYKGRRDQLPDPLIEAVEGAGQVPAYRGTAYVVFEDLDLTPFGNRVPQFSFEVVRPARPPAGSGLLPAPTQMLRSVALIPGTGEYALATEPVHYAGALGSAGSANVSAEGGLTDFAQSLETLRDTLPGLASVSIIYCWFGDDLRAGQCKCEPKVEDASRDGVGQPWRIAQMPLSAARKIAKNGEGRPVYGGTPGDISVIQAIQAIRAGGQEVMFYPLQLMEILPGNGKPDPWGGSEQAAFPWRGRITAEIAPGRPGSPDGTASNRAAVETFFGTVTAADFNVAPGAVTYNGPDEWSYSRYILHSAALCAAAGGVDAFCIGSELRGLTQMRDDLGFPFVERLVWLAAQVRSLLPDADLTYAADWSEYFGYQPADGSGDVFFHLDPVWADGNIDFIGIDNYMPLSDWRDGTDHADAAWPAVHDLTYLHANIEGGEGWDWYYASEEDRAAQIRTPITDGAGGTPWIYRYKGLRDWWSNPHFDRQGGTISPVASPWVPQSKPIRFTEFGCASIDKGTNQPNKFLDPKSSESAAPYFSTGQRDDAIQSQYLRAVLSYWLAPGRNPVSNVYGGPMLDMARAHAWAWDARSWPVFPHDLERWSDGTNWFYGHWLTGRMDGVPLDLLVAEICERAGLKYYDVSRLHGLVRGHVMGQTESARAALQPLMLAYGFHAVEREGKLVFLPLPKTPVTTVTEPLCALNEDGGSGMTCSRAARAETIGRLRVGFSDGEASYDARVSEAVHPGDASANVSELDLPLGLISSEALAIAERRLAEARVARDRLAFSLPPSQRALGAGDMVALEDGSTWRIDTVTDRGTRDIEAVRVEPSSDEPSDAAVETPAVRRFLPPLPVEPIFLDLPLLTGTEVEHAPHLAVAATPWPGSVAVYSAAGTDGYTLNRIVDRGAVAGRLLTPLRAAAPGLWDRGPAFRVQIAGGALSSAEGAAVLNGANAAAIGAGDGAGWEVIQFREARLVAPDVWEIALRLRGQAGSDADMPPEWPAGSLFVLLDGAVGQVSLPASARGLLRNWRIGPARRSLDDPSYVERSLAFPGIGLRPLRPAHLRAAPAGGDLSVSWIRRGRIDADSWEGLDVPLGEAAELYHLRIADAAGLKRQATLSAPAFTYTAAMRAADAPATPFAIEVAQLSDRFGPGPYARIEIND
jgi:hypothetical protein